MKSKIKYLTIGIIVGILFTSTIPAIAENVEVLLNSVGLKVNGVQTSQIGESYTLQNGNTVPYTISYKDTTYLPVRKIGEIFGVDIDYDNSTKNVIVGKDIQQNSEENSLSNLKVGDKINLLGTTTDKEYEEFKGLWDITVETIDVRESPVDIVRYTLIYKGNCTSYEDTISQLKSYDRMLLKKYMKELGAELVIKNARLSLYFGYGEEGYYSLLSFAIDSLQNEIISILFEE